MVWEGNLGIVTTFCCHNQANVEAFEALCPTSMWLNGAKCGSNDEVYQPYFPQGSFSFPYLDLSTLSGVLHMPNSHSTGYAYTD